MINFVRVAKKSVASMLRTAGFCEYGNDSLRPSEMIDYENIVTFLLPFLTFKSVRFVELD